MSASLMVMTALFPTPSLVQGEGMVNDPFTDFKARDDEKQTAIFDYKEGQEDVRSESRTFRRTKTAGLQRTAGKRETKVHHHDPAEDLN